MSRKVNIRTADSRAFQYGDQVSTGGRVISRDHTQHGNITVETRQGVKSLSPYDRIFRTPLGTGNKYTGGC
ncbi:MAG: hypothetical protein H6736_00340 [Alphaproteobacteria bacterium]|nr:hypothetical protein [Alphaproteobacteria bacterium]